ncbi:MAG: hypothetical protein QME68_03050 [Elusimicrobiota bacterium]|nr:hypothetical protein [Elusimicrobiota bacterium]
MAEKGNLESLLDELRKILSELKKEGKKKSSTVAPAPPPQPVPTPTPSPSIPPQVIPKPAPTPTPPPIPSPPPPPATEPIPSEELLKIGLLFPVGKFDLRDKFTNNLSDVIKKAAKKTFLPKVVFEQELDLSDITAVNWDEIVKSLFLKKIDATVLICSEKFETATLREKFIGSGIFFQAFTLTQLDRKIPYLDFLIELMLFKQK